MLPSRNTRSLLPIGVLAPSLAVAAAAPAIANDLFEAPVFYPGRRSAVRCRRRQSKRRRRTGSGGGEHFLRGRHGPVQQWLGGFPLEVRVSPGRRRGSIRRCRGPEWRRPRGHRRRPADGEPDARDSLQQRRGGVRRPLPVGSFAGFPDGLHVLRIDTDEHLDILLGSPSPADRSWSSWARAIELHHRPTSRPEPLPRIPRTRPPATSTGMAMSIARCPPR